MLHDNWLDLPCINILHSFCFKPRMVSDKNTWRNIFTIIFLCLFHKGITTKGESSCCLPKVLVLGQKLILGKPLNYASNWWSGFPSNINIWVPISRFMPSRFAIFMINICVYNLPFKVFMNRKYKGVEDLMCGNIGKINWFRRFLMWACIWWSVHEITSMLVNAIFLFRLQGCFFMNV